MRVTWINVGYGDAVIFQSENGYTALLDGGSNLPQEFAGDSYRIRSLEYLQSLGIDHIDSVIISHIHEDHVCGLKKIIENIKVDQYFVPYPIDVFQNRQDLKPEEYAAKSVFLYTNALNDYCEIIDKATASGKKINVIKPGDKLCLNEDLSIDVLAPKPGNISEYIANVLKAYDSTNQKEITEILTKLDATSNATSLLLKVKAGNLVYLMAADSCPREWNEIDTSAFKDVNVLKLPHHGQKDSVEESIMSLMPLDYVVTTASSDRRYNSANRAVYELLSSINPKGRAPEFLFIDEREYPPYFSKPEGFSATTIEDLNGIISLKFSRK